MTRLELQKLARISNANATNRRKGKHPTAVDWIIHMLEKRNEQVYGLCEDIERGYLGQEITDDQKDWFIAKVKNHFDLESIMRDWRDTR